MTCTSPKLPTITFAGSVLGTPGFKAPEQALGAVHKIDKCSDVFGLGGILAMILTGKPPFHSDSSQSALIMAADGDIGPCLERLQDCGAEPDWIAVAHKCLQPNRSLTQAVKAGWKDAAHIKNDKHLDPIRNRDDFKNLLADLEKKFPPPSELIPPPKELK